MEIKQKQKNLKKRKEKEKKLIEQGRQEAMNVVQSSMKNA